MNTIDEIRKQPLEHSIILYMKFTPESPRCGFSTKAAAVMQSSGVYFSYVDVPSSPRIMQALPEFSEFPTFPQLFFKGEIVGGSDIQEIMLANGELLALLDDTLA